MRRTKNFSRIGGVKFPIEEMLSGQLPPASVSLSSRVIEDGLTRRAKNFFEDGAEAHEPGILLVGYVRQHGADDFLLIGSERG
jgi:hypothetical protein